MDEVARVGIEPFGRLLRYLSGLGSTDRSEDGSVIVVGLIVPRISASITAADWSPAVRLT